MTVFTKPPILLFGTTSLRLGDGDKCIVGGAAATIRQAVYAAEVGPYVQAGDVLDINVTVHVTNDAFRPDPDPVEWFNTVYWSDDLSDSNQGSEILPTTQEYNVGDEAHHGLFTWSGRYVVPLTIEGSRYVKYVAYFRHPSGDNTTPVLKCPDNGFGIDVLWWRQ